MREKLLTLITAPGVVVHELGHYIFCVLSNVKVYRVKLFGFRNPLGFVEHEEPEKFFQSLLITFGPLTINSFIALVIFSRIREPYFYYLNFLLAWLGTAIALHAIPSRGDARTLVAIIKRKFKRNPLVLIGYPFVGVILLLNYLKRFHLHFLYAAVLFWLGNIYL